MEAFVPESVNATTVMSLQQCVTQLQHALLLQPTTTQCMFMSYRCRYELQIQLSIQADIEIQLCFDFWYTLLVFPSVDPSAKALLLNLVLHQIISLNLLEVHVTCNQFHNINQLVTMIMKQTGWRAIQKSVAHQTVI